MISIKTKSGKQYDGEVFAIDPVTKSIALVQPGSSSYTIVNPAHIAEIQGDLSKITAPDASLIGTIMAVDKKEEVALKQAERNINSINLAVSADAQNLFDRLNSIYTCTWTKEHGILALDNYIIPAPYTDVQVINPNLANPEEGRMRLVKLLEGTRKRLNLE